ncbi:hypothetical protein OEZ86_003359 [Tetradesmus obliquus]|nr:hypothetical protein OEZ86_003359 [Tetradesmus obliquus]
MSLRDLKNLAPWQWESKIAQKKHTVGPKGLQDFAEVARALQGDGESAFLTDLKEKQASSSKRRRGPKEADEAAAGAGKEQAQQGISSADLALAAITPALKIKKHRQAAHTPAAADPSSSSARNALANTDTNSSGSGSADPTGLILATDGCVASDTGFAANANFDLPNGTWSIYNVTGRFKANDPVKASSTLRVLVGDADMALMTQALRAADGPAKLAEAMKPFRLCSARRLGLLAEDRQRSFACAVGKEALTGQTVLFDAPGLTVCNVMVCAKRLQFSASGVPLT